MDHIDDMEKYVYTILNSYDQEDIECMKNYNDALEHNNEMHILHNKMEVLSNLDQDKLEDMKQKYNPKSEDIFESTWDLSETSEEETIVKELYEELSNLKIENIQDSDNSENSSNNTVIEAEKNENSQERQKFPDNVASCPPIPGGQVCTIVHSLGMESASELVSSTGTEASATPPQTLSSKYKYGSQVIHEKDCTCPYCYIRKSSKKKMSFSFNTANMVRQNRTQNVQCQDHQCALQKSLPAQHP